MRQASPTFVNSPSAKPGLIIRNQASCRRHFSDKACEPRVWMRGQVHTASFQTRADRRAVSSCTPASWLHFLSRGVDLYSWDLGWTNYCALLPKFRLKPKGSYRISELELKYHLYYHCSQSEKAAFISLLLGAPALGLLGSLLTGSTGQAQASAREPQTQTGQAGSERESRSGP